MKARGIAPYRLFSISQLSPNYWECYVVFIIVLIVLDIIIYIWRELE